MLTKIRAECANYVFNANINKRFFFLAINLSKKYTFFTIAMANIGGNQNGDNPIKFHFQIIYTHRNIYLNYIIKLYHTQYFFVCFFS